MPVTNDGGHQWHCQSPDPVDVMLVPLPDIFYSYTDQSVADGMMIEASLHRRIAYDEHH